MESFGDRMRRARHKAGINAYQLAGALGVSKAVISAYESGEVEPSWERKVTIAAKLRFSLQPALPPQQARCKTRPWPDATNAEFVALAREDVGAFTAACIAIDKAKKGGTK